MGLDEYLADAMAERHGLGKAGANKALMDALEKNPALLEQAQIRLKHYDSPDGKSIQLRDHVSRIHCKILKEALKVDV